MYDVCCSTLASAKRMFASPDPYQTTEIFVKPLWLYPRLRIIDKHAFLNSSCEIWHMGSSISVAMPFIRITAPLWFCRCLIAENRLAITFITIPLNMGEVNSCLLLDNFSLYVIQPEVVYNSSKNKTKSKSNAHPPKTKNRLIPIHLHSVLWSRVLKVHVWYVWPETQICWNDHHGLKTFVDLPTEGVKT